MGERRVKKIFELSVVEILILIFIISVFFITLNFFNVIKLSSLPLLSFLPTQNSKLKSITAVSDVSGYTLKVKDEKGLVKLLSDWRIFGGSFTGGYGVTGSTISFPVLKIIARFTNKEQPINQFVNTDSSVYMSSLTDAAPGQLTVSIYISPSILNDQSKQKGLSSYFDTQFLVTAYRLSHPETKMEEYKKSEKILQDFLVKKNKKGIQYFELVKK